MSTPLSSLTPGQRFQLAAIPERVGRLLRIGVGSALVEWGSTRVEGWTGEEAEFSFRRSEQYPISLSTEVNPL